MNTNLFEVLCDRNIINDNTEIEAKIKRSDLSGASYMKFVDTFYYVAHVIDENDVGKVIVSDTSTGITATIDMNDIVKVDGMEPSRLASIYALNEFGESVRQGARRGRKPKNRLAA